MKLTSCAVTGYVFQHTFQSLLASQTFYSNDNNNNNKDDYNDNNNSNLVQLSIKNSFNNEKNKQIMKNNKMLIIYIHIEQ